MDTLIAPLQPVIVAPEQVPAIRPFNFDMKVLLTTEDTAGAMSVIMAWHNPGEGPPDHVHFNQPRHRAFLPSRAREETPESRGMPCLLREPADMQPGLAWRPPQARR